MKGFALGDSSGCSVARLSRLVWDQEVASSNLAIPTNYQIAFSLIGKAFLFSVFTIFLSSEFNVDRLYSVPIAIGKVASSNLRLRPCLFECTDKSQFYKNYFYVLCQVFCKKYLTNQSLYRLYNYETLYKKHGMQPLHHGGKAGTGKTKAIAGTG